MSLFIAYAAGFVTPFILLGLWLFYIIATDDEPMHEFNYRNMWGDK